MTEITQINVSDDRQVMVDDGDFLPEIEPVRFVLTLAEGGERLDKVVARHLPAYSRSRIQKWIEHGNVTVNGAAAKPKQVMAGVEEVVVIPQLSDEETAFTPEPVDFPVVYEDDALLVVDKPAGLVVHPAAGNWHGTLLNGLLYRLPKSATVPRAGIVHRLDKDTTGLMVVAKTIEAQTDLVRQLQARTVHREYFALVWGEPALDGTVSAPIGRHPRNRIKMAVSTTGGGRHAVTHFQRLAEGSLNGSPVSLIKCRLETGRTHQIRVHMQAIGCPLVGDPLYGSPHLAAVFPRQALHAFRLGLQHPVRKDPVAWTASVPADMAALLESASISLDEDWYGTDHP